MKFLEVVGAGRKMSSSSRELRRVYKRQVVSDQQKRRDLSLLRQEQSRLDAQKHARCLASSVFFLRVCSSDDSVHTSEFDDKSPSEEEYQSLDVDFEYAAKIKGAAARLWFASQLMLPEWMIDVPERLNSDWYVFARPSGKRCFVVSSNGTTVSRLRNGSILHYFPSALPSGARNRDVSSSGQSYCILDCIFHELNHTYYVIDMVCWRGYSLYDCTAEFRFFWLNSKLTETGACDSPSTYHKYRFSVVPVYNCDQDGLHNAYLGGVSYVRDGMLFYNKHAHYQSGNTPLALVWKDNNCSEYVFDTDSNGQVPFHQQVVLELQAGGSLASSDDPPVMFGHLDEEFVQKSGLEVGCLLRFSVKEGGFSFLDRKLQKADLQYIGKANKSRSFADTYSKVLFQHMVRHSALTIEELFSAISGKEISDTDMVE